NPRRVGHRTETLELESSPFVIAPGRLLVPLVRTGRLGARLEGAGEGAVTWNGRLLGRGRLPLAVEAPAALVRRGLNDVRIEGAAARALVLIETPDWPPLWTTLGAP